jgi:hypothetical protein
MPAPEPTDPASIPSTSPPPRTFPQAAKIVTAAVARINSDSAQLKTVAAELIEARKQLAFQTALSERLQSELVSVLSGKAVDHKTITLATQHRPPTVVLTSIDAKASDVRSAATELSARITWFEDYLSKLPGRVETEYHGPHPDATTINQQEEMALVLKLHREGKAWILSVGSYHEHFTTPEDPIDFKPLADASLKYKIAAVKMFPNLLAAIETSQSKLVQELNAATAEFDAFASQLKEGK